MKHPSFTIFKSEKDGQYYFHLQARNGRIIFNSKGEGYTQKHNGFGGIESVKENCLIDGQWQTFKSLVAIGNKPYWRWFNRLLAGNLEILGGNQSFKTKRAAENNLKSVQRCAVAAVIVDKTKD